MIWELAGKCLFVVSAVATATFAWCAIKDRRIQYIAWQKRTQAAMTSERARMEQADDDRAVCAELELLPVSDESDD